MHLRKVTIIVTLGEKNHGSHMTGKELGARKGNPGGQRHAVTSKRSQDWNPANGDKGHAGFLFLSLQTLSS